MDELFTLTRRRVARRDGRLRLVLASAVAAALVAANRLVLALRRSRMRQEMSTIELAARLRRADTEPPPK